MNEEINFGILMFVTSWFQVDLFDTIIFYGCNNRYSLNCNKCMLWSCTSKYINKTKWG